MLLASNIAPMNISLVVGLLQIGCTIAVHTGPYALGMGVMRRWKKQG